MRSTERRIERPRVKKRVTKGFFYQDVTRKFATIINTPLDNNGNPNYEQSDESDIRKVQVGWHRRTQAILFDEQRQRLYIRVVIE
jgi:hypothetical protein